ncbi:MAG: cell division protein FtsH, partial [Alphaproteobacteria bacterium]|nr:cell division protein FtsH [Alphaproteobacteria bacterium]
ARTQHISEKTAELIDQEVRHIIDEGEKKAREILTKHLKDLHKVAKALLEYETLSADDIELIRKGKKIDRGDDSEPTAKTGEKPRASVPTTSKKPRSDGGMEPEPQGT